MAMQGVDVSNWQNGINLSTLPIDFAICKATEGTSYVSPDCDRQVQQAIKRGICWGVYHYINGSGAVAEANHFAESIKGYIGKGILVLDWESGGNAAWGNLSYLETMIVKVKELTGVTPLIYASQSVFPWSLASKYGCGTWVAQYANMNATGLQANPWNEGAYACTIRQYASTGRLTGWGGNLDLNKAYIDASQWQALAAVGGQAAQPAPEPAPADTSVANRDELDLVAGVWSGEFGIGDERKRKLGARYDEVQAMVNHIASASVATLVSETWAGKYRNGDERKAILAHRFDEVMAAINGKSIDAVAREVIAGKWGNGAERKVRLESAGYDYAAVQKRVNELL